MSKRISYLLRHHPEDAGLEMDPHGYVDVQELLDHAIDHHPMTLEELKTLMAQMDKPRFSFSEDQQRIRANHGHSVPIDLDLQDETPPDMLWHGTATRFTSSIDQQGLQPMGRLYVHLSPEQSMAREVGSRHGRLALYTVDAAAMKRDGFRFFHTADNVWLTDHVPPRYLTRQPG